MTDYLITNSAAILGGVEDASVPGTFDPAFASHAIRLDEAEDPGLTLPPVNDVWVHADYYFDDHDTTVDGDGHFWMIAVPNAEIVMIDVLNGCGFRKFPDRDCGNSRTRISVIPGQGFR